MNGIVFSKENIIEGLKAKKNLLFNMAQQANLNYQYNLQRVGQIGFMPNGTSNIPATPVFVNHCYPYNMTPNQVLQMGQNNLMNPVMQIQGMIPITERVNMVNSQLMGSLDMLIGNLKMLYLINLEKERQARLCSLEGLDCIRNMNVNIQDQEIEENPEKNLIVQNPLVVIDRQP
jgi:hypothetical protein